jgi:hypothetical protein
LYQDASLLDLYQSAFMRVCFYCGCAAAASVHAAFAAQEHIFVALLQNKDIKKCILIQLHSVFVLRQSRKNVFSCGKIACTNTVAVQPQRKNAKINYYCSFSLIYYFRVYDYNTFEQYR